MLALLSSLREKSKPEESQNLALLEGKLGLQAVRELEGLLLELGVGELTLRLAVDKDDYGG